MPHFDFFDFPHIKYISLVQEKSEQERTLYYLGGEPYYNDCKLTIGKKYLLREVLYSPNSEVERVKTWICDSDNKEKKCEIYNKNNFGKIDKLRDRKINKILNGEENK